MTRRRYYKGPESDHFDGRRFFNPGQPSTDRPLSDLLKWRLLGDHAPWSNRPASLPVTRPATRVDGVAITMIGHASILLQAAGVNILLDPVWSERASPVSFIGPKRWDLPGIAFDNLPPIDVVLLTHSHYDHFDGPTLRRLCAAHRPRIIAPLGNDAVLARAVPDSRADVGDWGDRFAIGADLAVTLHPAYHWSARRPGDRRMALWCGFVVETALGAIYLAGDTAYGDGVPFRQVRERFGPPLVAVLPIGAYEPRWFMRNQHANPAEAVQIMLDCGAQRALGVHWGTFRLTDEARDAPAVELHRACQEHGVGPAQFMALRPGDVWRADIPSRIGS